jgi:signal transduction histidine kinase
MRILLVEDNPADARLIRERLRERGNEVEIEHVVRLGSAVRKLAEASHGFDAILLDLSLPDATGLDTVRRMRAAAPLIPIAVLSGRDDEATALQALREGVEDYLSKDEADARALLRALRHAIERRRSTNQLAASEAALREAGRRKDEFLAMLAHELRNPLAPIRNAVHIMRLAGPLDSRLTRVRDIIERQVQHMARLLDDLLDSARISRGRVELQQERIDLRTAIEDALEASRPAIEAAGHSVNVILPGDPAEVDGDHTRLTQVFANLLDNAAKYTPRGGRIGVELEPATPPAPATVRISDTGIGIAEPMREQIFELFTQLDATLDRAGGGLGIGLTLARQLVRMHGGEIEVRDRGAEPGSEFIVRLPLAAAERDPTGHGRPAHHAGRQRILVADSDLDALESLGLLLAAHGHAVATTQRGQEVLELASRFAPDVLMLDLGMAGIDGKGTVRRLRALPGGRQAILIATSRGDRQAAKRAARDAGFDFHLATPVEPDELERLLQSIASA